LPPIHPGEILIEEFLQPMGISVPPSLIWGIKDSFFVRGLVQQSINRCDEGKLVFIEEASHWVQHEESEQVNELLGVHLCSIHKESSNE